MNKYLYGVTFRVANGATRDDAAKEAFLKGQALGDCGPVFLEYREKRYRVMLAVHEVSADGQYVGKSEDTTA